MNQRKKKETRKVKSPNKNYNLTKIDLSIKTNLHKKVGEEGVFLLFNLANQVDIMILLSLS